MAKTIFTSDLHLSPSTHELNDLFYKFLDYVQSQEVDALYILGDFFNYWIGNDCLTDWHQQLILAFTKLRTKTKIYFLVGNRDFLVNHKTAEIFNFELIPEDTKCINLYGQKVVILHGDTLCTNDKKYQFFRKFVRNPLIKFIYSSLPLKLRLNLAQELKNKSKRNFKKTIDHSIFDVTEAAVLDLFASSRTNLMIHGHTHKPNTHQYKSNNSELTRYVLGDWHADGAYYLEVAPKSHGNNNNGINNKEIGNNIGNAADYLDYKLEFFKTTK